VQDGWSAQSIGQSLNCTENPFVKLQLLHGSLGIMTLVVNSTTGLGLQIDGRRLSEVTVRLLAFLVREVTTSNSQSDAIEPTLESMRIPKRREADPSRLKCFLCDVFRKRGFKHKPTRKRLDPSFVSAKEDVECAP
jgi:hypothetical protein